MMHIVRGMVTERDLETGVGGLRGGLETETGALWQDEDRGHDIFLNFQET